MSNDYIGARNYDDADISTVIMYIVVSRTLNGNASEESFMINTGIYVLDRCESNSHLSNNACIADLTIIFTLGNNDVNLHLRIRINDRLTASILFFLCQLLPF